MGTTIWSGLTLGAVYVVVASGFTLSLLPSGVFNFAQGAIVVGGTFLGYLWLQTLGLPEVVAVILNAIAGAIAGIACEVFTIRPLRWGRAVPGGPIELVTTVGMSTALLGAMGLIWGYDPLRVPFNGPSGTVSFLGVHAAPIEIILVAFAIAAPLALGLGFKMTRVGRACLAVAEDRDAATLRGINVSLLSIGGFAVAGALGGVAAIAIGPVTYAVPTLVNTIALGGFVAIALGGEGSFYGALGGGMAVGLVSSFATRYLGAEYSDVAVFVVLLSTLALRPRGLGGMVEARSV
jgi:branched-chain amino acid transport system permease protein